MTEKYYPEPVPYTDDLPYIREFLFREFLRISASFEGVREIELEELSTEPVARAGMIKFADGVNWDPGGGRGFYAYDGTNWLKLSVTTGASFSDGIDFGSAVAASPQDLSRHIALWSNSYGFSITGSQLNYNVATNADHVWYSSATELMRYDSSAQQLVLPQGRVRFPAAANPSTDVNTLDDYEEGTWTPALTFGGASTGITYLSQDGSYVKIGQLVHIFLRIRLTSKGTAVGTANITGCPFIANNDITNGVYDTGIAAYYTGMAGMASHPAGYINRGSSLIVLTHAGPTARTNMTEANFTDATDILMSITYRADA